MNIALRRAVASQGRNQSPESGSCFHCGMPWTIVRSHSTMYTKVQACFPLCEDCWNTLSVEERVPYYRQLAYMWNSRPHDGCPTADELEAACRAEVGIAVDE